MSLLDTSSYFLNDFISEIEDNVFETVFFDVIVLYNTFPHYKKIFSLSSFIVKKKFMLLSQSFKNLFSGQR